MKIILIGNATCHAAVRMAEEAEKMNVEFVATALESVILSVTSKGTYLTSVDTGDISDGDCYIFRGIGDADQETMIIAKYVKRMGATIVEEKTANGALMMDKLLLRAAEQHLPTPDYSLIQSAKALAELSKTLTYPVVMKSTIGSMGANVALIKSEAELLENYEHLGPRVIIQEYLPITSDVRAIVVGGACLGAFSRTRDDGEFRMNRSGSQQEVITLPPEAVDLCVRAAEAQNIEVAGVDLMEHNGTWYIIEINTSPQFKRFEAKTGLNVAKEILNYAIEKTSK